MFTLIQHLGRSPGEDPAGETELNIRNTITELSADNKVGEKNLNLENKLYCLQTIKYLEIPYLIVKTILSADNKVSNPHLDPVPREDPAGTRVKVTWGGPGRWWLCT